ncbi:sulfotransferase domain-containing protein [Bacteroides thetaiotaomicron]|nr:sulfotransferase domain-containing protein [Bacteroides thetaiotaomicron]
MTTFIIILLVGDHFFKEPGFFLYPTEYAKGFPFFMEYMWKEYPPFRYSLSDSLLFESTTWYSYWHEVPERLFEYNPHLKFIFLVRNPIDRAYSQYNMLINWRKSQLLHEYELFPDKEKLNILLKKLLDTQNFPFSYWVNLEIEKIRNQENTPIDFFPDFLHRGFYYEQLERYYQFFPVENILVIEHRELKNNRISTLRKIEQFLNIPYVDWNTINLDDKFVSQYNVKLPSDIRNKLKAFFKLYNEKFYKLIKRNFDW